MPPLPGYASAGHDRAQGTRVCRWADTRSVFVLLPRQTHGANASRCWNWFDSAPPGATQRAFDFLARIGATR